MSQETKTPHRSSRIVPLVLILCGALVLMFALGVAGVVWLVQSGVSSTTQAVGDALAPRITRNQVVNVLLTQQDSQPKLVVLTQSVDVILEASDRLERLYIHWGTNKVRLELRANRVQWVLPLDALTEEDVLVDEDAGRVTILLPAPYLDRDMVAVQSNPALIMEERSTGWARLGSSTRELADEQKQEIIKHVVQEADTPEARAEAAKLAVAAFRELFTTALSNHPLAADLIFEISVREPDPAPE